MCGVRAHLEVGDGLDLQARHGRELELHFLGLGLVDGHVHVRQEVLHVPDGIKKIVKYVLNQTE